jgi:hypothetical protein
MVNKMQVVYGSGHDRGFSMNDRIRCEVHKAESKMMSGEFAVLDVPSIWLYIVLFSATDAIVASMRAQFGLSQATTLELHG